MQGNETRAQDYDRDDAALRALVEPTRVRSEVYTDEAVFALEIERIWGRAWIYVGHESQVASAGDFITTTIGLTPLVIERWSFPC